LPRLELGFAACPAGAVQGAEAAALPLRVPPAHALPAHLELTSDVGQNHLAGSKQAACLFAPVLELLKIAAGTNLHRHTSSIDYRASPVTILREIQ
jgi:hypothetical protein